MTAELYAIGLVVVLAAMYFFFAPMAGAFVKFRGKRVIICPETLRAAAVDVDVAHAALTAVAGNPDLRLTTCTRWPERKDCGQECLLQIEISPEGCLARTMLEDWYRGKKCVLCRVEIGEIYWSDHKPAMLSPQGRITECGDISPEQLPDVFVTHQPVCWACAVTASLLGSHPEVAVDRSRIRPPIVRGV